MPEAIPPDSVEPVTLRMSWHLPPSGPWILATPHCLRCRHCAVYKGLAADVFRKRA